MAVNKTVHTELNLMVTLQQTSQAEDFHKPRTTFKEKQAQVNRYVNRALSDGMSHSVSLKMV